MEKMARVRTIKKALLSLHEKDAESCITENFIRSAVRAGSIKSIKSGNRFLIDEADLENLIESMQWPSVTPNATGIRRVEARR